MRALSLVLLLTVSLTPDATAPAAEPIDFDTQVMPILTRQGCNGGACHGAAIGRGGFKLSLLGSQAAVDHEAIVQQLEGRRVNLADPGKSLLLLKPSEQIGHEGGRVLPEDSEAFDWIHRWIAEGAQRRGSRLLRELTIVPEERVLSGPGEHVSVEVLADFGGEPADVARWTVFQPADPAAVTVDPGGRQFTVHRRGVHIVIARFLDRVMAIRLTVPMQDGEPAVGEAVADEEHPIDQHIAAQLRKLRLSASPATDDWAFLRRVTLDLTGRLPFADAARRFAADSSAGKRRDLIRHLLASDAFADYWALKWANELGIDSKQLQPEGAAAYHRWLVDRLRSDAPLDQTVRMMLTTDGDGYANGPVNFVRSGSSPGDLAERTARFMLGVRLQCANCHDHPLDHWKQDDYHGLAAIFARIDRGRLVSTLDRGEVTHPATGQPAVPRIPGNRYLAGDADGRQALADWLTSADNSYLATATVNRLWQQLMGRGLVDPVDDLRDTNPATHPELLRWLAEDFVDHGLRVKHTIELICSSAAYGRQSTIVAGNPVDSAFYSHTLVRPLEAEVVADAIADVTGIPLQVGADELPRAVTLTDNRMDVPSLAVLGRCDREQACGSSRVAAVSLGRSLHLINGELVNSRVRAHGGRLHQLLASTPDDGEVLEEILLWTMTRPSTAGSESWQTQLSLLRGAGAQQRAEFFEDLLWALLTSRTFATNH